MLNRKSNVSNVAIWGLNRIGDAVYTLPLIEALAARFGTVSVLTQSFLAPLYHRNGVMVEVVDGVRQGWRSLRHLRPDAVVLLHNAAKYAVAAWVARVPERIGYNKEYRKPFLTQWLPYPNTLIHRLEYNARLGDLLGVDARNILPSLRLEKEVCERVLSRYGLVNKRYVALVVGSIALSRRMPPWKFAQMAEQLAVSGYSSVIVGGDADRMLAQLVIQSSKVPIMDLTGQTLLDETIALFQSAAGVITNDTGPMHLAAATGVPVVTWFGPARVEEIAPPFDNVDLFVPELDCIGCLKEVCPLGHNKCLEVVSIEERVRALLKLMESAERSLV